MIITICGKPGSGKSTVAEYVSKRLGMNHYSTGDFRGELAMEKGMTIDELNDLGMKEDWTDKLVDKRTKELAEKEDNFVMDTWLAWNFIPKALKVFLEVKPYEGAKRIHDNPRPDEEKKDTVEETMEMLDNRVKNTTERYKKYYKVDFLDMNNYDVIIDTTGKSVEEVGDEIIRLAREKEEK